MDTDKTECRDRASITWSQVEKKKRLLNREEFLSDYSSVRETFFDERWRPNANLRGFWCSEALIRRSTVGFLAVADAEDFDRIAMIVKADAPIADAQTELGRMNAAESVDVAGAGGGEAVDCGNDAEGDWAVQCGQVCLRLCRKNDAPAHAGSW
jgi:hypothetical protein